MPGEASPEPIDRAIQRYSDHVKEQVAERIEKWRINFGSRDCHEAVGALLARQAQLAIGIVGCPHVWNGHLAPILLRAMADVYINLAWLLGVPNEWQDRSKRYVLYGLGQAKLELEHRRAAIGNRQPTSEETQILDAEEGWINSQRWTFLTEVNVGSWSGLNTRQMAEEAECLDFYNYVYSPFSACSHSMWHHVARYNLKQCVNPLHQFHHVPRLEDPAVEPDYAYLAAKYLEKTFHCFDRATGVTIEGMSSFEVFVEEIHRRELIVDRKRGKPSP